MLTFTTGAALIIGAAACATDLHSRRIPNWLTFGAAAGALAYHYIVGGPASAQSAMSGWVTGLFMFMPLFLLGGMGAGDAFWLAIYTSMAGGVIALVVAFRSGYLRTALHNIGGLARFWWMFGPRPMPAVTLENSAAPKLAYAIPIFVGTVVTLWQR
jgi:prepilin peptidase CpaA